jgi:hypothetical protein
MTSGSVATGLRSCAACVLLASGGLAIPAAGAQTASQFAAWDALMLSPIGALNPTISGADAQAPTDAIALRFGRWRYNTDDAAHETYAVTWSHALGSRTRGSFTAGHLFLSCAQCGGWEVAGLDFESTLWQAAMDPLTTRPARASLGARLALGGGLLRGDPASVARSTALEVPIDVSVRYRTTHELRASLTPGLGYGSMWAQGAGSDGGMLPMLGLAVASALTSSLGMELGAHRVFIAGGPFELGVSLIWGIR